MSSSSQVGMSAPRETVRCGRRRHGPGAGHDEHPRDRSPGRCPTRPGRSADEGEGREAGRAVGAADPPACAPRYDADGPAGLVSRQRGRPSNHCLRDDLRERAVVLSSGSATRTSGRSSATRALLELHTSGSAGKPSAMARRGRALDDTARAAPGGPSPACPPGRDSAAPGSRRTSPSPRPRRGSRARPPAPTAPCVCRCSFYRGPDDYGSRVSGGTGGGSRWTGDPRP